MPCTSRCNEITLDSIAFDNIEQLENVLNNMESLNSLKIINCSIKTASDKALASIGTLTRIHFEKFNDAIFSAFTNQTALEKITVL